MRFITGLSLLVGLAFFDNFLFTSYLNRTYLDWYLNNGVFIGLVTSVVSMTWSDMTEMTGIISAHPFTYINACRRFIGLPIFVLGTNTRPNQEGDNPRSAFDTLMTIPFVLMLTVVMVAWFVVVAPLQYFVFLICAAPARTFARSTRRPIARMKDGKLEIAEIGKSEKIPDGWWNASLASKPVTSANMFQALFFFVLQPFLN
ncbi:MAG: hypothetical protein HY646_20155 [Acidobacteria bacterium]|nr:hypothetical protein [Acidobacteriota bacterium]